MKKVIKKVNDLVVKNNAGISEILQALGIAILVLGIASTIFPDLGTAISNKCTSIITSIGSFAVDI